ncbi:undecaprenyl-phosphate galactose phosphotransferase WbaP [Pelistega sp. NLN82]|uniref:Undecaprenyl-phosphate galactose phosphotransferase WbaP n=1 Tax=Pelistega ratti TaxID=2652177 RepID=A0A6L9Y4L6_9BURK|nr:undecaprenyl-phosphate galactose phosphotransferase WbaP [Pelistega ratti]NEN75369.1 undecaprenyl-phosphate galactose phosphotransferase WbaP [Pelistega ratti]
MLNRTPSKLIIAFCDFFLIFISFYLAISVMRAFVGGNIDSFLPNSQFSDRLWIHLFIAIIGMGWFWIRLRHYTYRKPFWFEQKEIVRTLIILSVIELAIIAFSKLYSSRNLWVLTWIIALFLVPIGRFVVKSILIKSGAYLKNTIIIGAGENAVDTYRALMEERYLGLNIQAFIVLKHKHPDLTSLGVPILENFDKANLASICDQDTQFTIAIEDDELHERNAWLRFLTNRHYRFVSVIPTLRGLPLYSTNIVFLFSHELIMMRISNNLAKRSSRFIKRTFDIFGSLAIITILSPLLIILFFLIKRDGGNAIYGHPRIGRKGKTFNCLKFRSMVVNSKEILEELLVNDPEARAEWEKDFKLKNDPRITKIGHFLRKTSLDELPQLFNVLKGEMSLVGPRPIVKDELERYEEDVDYYLMAKPGMTGLWQVSGRNDVDYEKRVYFDAWYVKNWSLWNDIAILCKTVNVVLKRKGAY